MKVKILSILFVAAMFSVVACNQNKTSSNKDTVVVEKSTSSSPSTSVKVDANGASVSTKSTKVTVSTDSLTLKKE